MRRRLPFLLTASVFLVVVIAAPIPVAQRTTEAERVRLGEDIRNFSLAMGFLWACGSLLPTPVPYIVAGALRVSLVPQAWPTGMFWLGWSSGATLGIMTAIHHNWDVFRRMSADEVEAELDKVAFRASSAGDGLDGFADLMERSAGRLRGDAQGIKDAEEAERMRGLAERAEGTAAWLRSLGGGARDGGKKLSDFASELAKRIAGETSQQSSGGELSQ